MSVNPDERTENQNGANSLQNNRHEVSDDHYSVIDDVDGTGQGGDNDSFSLENERYLDDRFAAEPHLRNNRGDVNMHDLYRMFASLSSQSNLSAMPELLRTIPDFDGDPSKAPEWLERLNSIKMLHQLPDNYILEVARSHLVAGAKFWYNSCQGQLLTWLSFDRKFRTTFYVKESVTELWQRMARKTQHKGESIHSYFHEKVSLCKKLNMSIADIIEQVLIGQQCFLENI